MGMFKLLNNFAAYNSYISEFKRQHSLNPFTAVSVLGKAGYGRAGQTPLQYPCLISSTKAFMAVRNKVLRGDGTTDIVDAVNKVIINEIYYRPQAKKLVYPSKGPLAMPKAVRIDSSADFDIFIETFWMNYRRNNEAENSEQLQVHQANKLCENVFVENLPCIVTSGEINIDNLLTTVVVFFVLTKEEAKGLVYHSKNMDLKRQKYDVIRAYGRDDIPF